MKKAIIDLGTNTFNLLLVEIKTNGQFQLLLEEKIPVRLGKGGLTSNSILPDALIRAVDALLKFKQTATDFDIKNILAVGTSAIRNATNKSEFKQEIFEKTGIQINEIDGSTEALLIYYGVKNSGVLKHCGTSLIMDIGGGSTEFILADEHQVFWRKSYDLGVARLLEKFLPEDPILPQQLNQVRTYISQELNELLDQLKIYQPSEFIGSSGSFDTFLALQKQITAPITYCELDFSLLQSTFQTLKNSTLAQRKAMKGMHQIRAEFIVLSAVLTEFVLQQHSFKNYYQSEYSLKEGLIFDTSLTSNS